MPQLKQKLKLGLPRVWKEGINDNKHMNKRYNLIGNNAVSSNLRVNSSLSRKEEILLAKLIIGHCRLLLLGDFYHMAALKIGSLNRICRWCRSKKESVEHILKGTRKQ